MENETPLSVRGDTYVWAWDPTPYNGSLDTVDLVNPYNYPEASTITVQGHQYNDEPYEVQLADYFTWLNVGDNSPYSVTLGNDDFYAE